MAAETAAGFISEKTMKNAGSIRESFQSAKPFKFVYMDDFFELPAAEKLLEDFPAFDKRRAVTELGDVGLKAFNTRLADISPFYRSLYDYLLSQEFLDQMSLLTGIPDLLADPALFGGGTHENLNGQSLDPHVDFNYSENGQVHRRLNLLLYLNKDWDASWGGSIELHSNPRDPDHNQITAINVTFNRALIFETNEISWHGFSEIRLPEQLRNRSRKSLSIYLYTKDRPTNEIVGPHSTFYVQRPLEPRFQAGYVLNDSDVAYLRNSFRKRDRMLEFYHKMDEQWGRERLEAVTYAEKMIAAISLPLLGYALQKRRLAGGIWSEGWASREWKFEMKAVRKLETVRIAGYLHEWMLEQPRVFHLEIDGEVTEFVVSKSGAFELSAAARIDAGQTFTAGLKCDADFSAKEKGMGEDTRRLAYVLIEVEFS